jgi:flagellar protein FlbD
MIEVTRLNDKKFMINPDLIEQLEEVPDTSITLTTGKHFIVKETPLEIKKKIIEYKREIFGQEFLK